MKKDKYDKEYKNRVQDETTVLKEDPIKIVSVPFKQSKGVIVDCCCVNVRKDADINSESLFITKRDKEVIILDKKNDYFYIEVDNRKGYIPIKYVGVYKNGN